MLMRRRTISHTVPAYAPESLQLAKMDFAVWGGVLVEGLLVGQAVVAR